MALWPGLGPKGVLRPLWIRALGARAPSTPGRSSKGLRLGPQHLKMLQSRRSLVRVRSIRLFLLIRLPYW